jgi:hypothetical protein
MFPGAFSGLVISDRQNEAKTFEAGASAPPPM